MQISKQPTKVTITLDPRSYWLRKTAYFKFDSFDPNLHGEYCLTHRIDMSYKGKADQEGSLFMFLNEEEAQVFIDAGFEELT